MRPLRQRQVLPGCAHVLLASAALLSGVLHASAAGAAPVTYVQLTSPDAMPIRVGPSDTIRFTVSGSGCRPTQYDVPPAVNGSVVEFTLAFNAWCFSPPPAFGWRADLPAPAPGVYEVRYYRQSYDGVPIGARTLVQTRRIIVGERPDALERSGAGTLDRSFGSDGIAQLPGGFTNASVVAVQRSGAVVFRANVVPGVPFARLDGAGAVDGAFPPENAVTQPASGFYPRMTVGANDVIWVAGTSSEAGSRDKFTMRRFGPDGVEMPRSIIESALLREEAETPERPTVVNVMDLAAMPDGKVVAAGMAGSWGSNVICDGNAFFVRYAADGTLDASFGSGGIVQAAFPGCVARIAPSRSGGIWLLGAYDLLTSGAFLARLEASGRLDPAFGQGGLAFGAFARVPPVELQDGRVLAGGAGFSLVRLMPNGAIDATFGDRGVLENPTPYALTLQDFRLDADGRTTLLGADWRGSDGPSSTLYRPIVVRYDATHALDESFGDHGVLEAPVSTYVQGGLPPFEAMTLLPLASGQWLLATNSSTGSTKGNTALHVLRFRGGADPSRAPVTEFHHSGFDHYFYTANPQEIALLDRGVIGGWTRTGLTFNAYANAPGDGADVCRFFSAAFAPRSSHLFTANAVECEAVKSYPAWTFEGVAFRSPLPDANGNCRDGTSRIYRLYNNGQGGAPAHRLVADATTQFEMIRAGWQPEGYGDNRVAMCSPW